jgi:hypothetical protein
LEGELLFECPIKMQFKFASESEQKKLICFVLDGRNVDFQYRMEILLKKKHRRHLLKMDEGCQIRSSD